MYKKIKRIIAGTALMSTLCWGSAAWAADYTVNAGDNLWQIAQKHQTSVEQLMAVNGLASDNLQIGQVLQLPGAAAVTAQSVASNHSVTINAKATVSPAANLVPAAAISPAANPVSSSSTLSHLVQPGDSPYLIAQKHHVSLAALLNANGLTDASVIYPGQKITIPAAGASATSTALASPAQAPAAPSATVQPAVTGSGQLVDWYQEGQGLLKCGTLITVVDLGTQRQFQMRVLSAGNHADVEPLTKQDTATMLQIFGKWQWSPRPVMLSVGGRKIAASLSGQPHDISTINDNGVDGHFDLYLHNSQPHGSGISRSYVQQHRDAVVQAANSR